MSETPGQMLMEDKGSIPSLQQPSQNDQEQEAHDSRQEMQHQEDEALQQDKQGRSSPQHLQSDPWGGNIQ